MGRLTKADTTAPYLRLKTRLESLYADRRFAFMFAAVARDNLTAIMSSLLRIPVSKKPLTIIDLSGVPSEIVDVVVSLVFRMTFDFAVWAEKSKMPPILLICEEAHRYVPADPKIGFAADDAGDCPHLQGRSQIWNFARAGYPAPVGTFADCADAMRYAFRHCA